jgi:hypothetical protein
MATRWVPDGALDVGWWQAVDVQAGVKLRKRPATQAAKQAAERDPQLCFSFEYRNIGNARSRHASDEHALLFPRTLSKPISSTMCS